MKKIGILLAILLVAGVCAMADETGSVQSDLFADIDAVALSQVEMGAVDGDAGAAEVAVAVKVVKFAVVNVAVHYGITKLDNHLKETRGRSLVEQIDRSFKRGFTRKGRVDRMMGR